VLAPGLILDHDAIEGFSLDMVGRTGSARFTRAPNTPRAPGQRPAVRRGRRAGHLHPPATEMKCAGAPLKHTFLIDDRLRRAGNRENAE
jgi:sulfide:quinone oxidoreductase